MLMKRNHRWSPTPASLLPPLIESPTRFRTKFCARPLPLLRVETPTFAPGRESRNRRRDCSLHPPRPPPGRCLRNSRRSSPCPCARNPKKFGQILPSRATTRETGAPRPGKESGPANCAPSGIVRISPRAAAPTHKPAAQEGGHERNAGILVTSASRPVVVRASPPAHCAHQSGHFHALVWRQAP